MLNYNLLAAAVGILGALVGALWYTDALTKIKSTGDTPICADKVHPRRIRLLALTGVQNDDVFPPRAQSGGFCGILWFKKLATISRRRIEFATA